MSDIIVAIEVEARTSAEYAGVELRQSRSRHSFYDFAVPAFVVSRNARLRAVLSSAMD